eukprot:3325097-Pleurochrysis_carterae.AAC.1
MHLGPAAQILSGRRETGNAKTYLAGMRQAARPSSLENIGTRPRAASSTTCARPAPMNELEKGWMSRSRTLAHKACVLRKGRVRCDPTTSTAASHRERSCI